MDKAKGESGHAYKGDYANEGKIPSELTSHRDNELTGMISMRLKSQMKKELMTRLSNVL